MESTARFFFVAQVVFTFKKKAFERIVDLDLKGHFFVTDFEKKTRFYIWSILTLGIHTLP